MNCTWWGASGFQRVANASFSGDLARDFSRFMEIRMLNLQPQPPRCTTRTALTAAIPLRLLSLQAPSDWATLRPEFLALAGAPQAKNTRNASQTRIRLQ
jgi:hypothetical protein